MPLAQALLPEFDQETATTRRLLELVPAERAGWKPHARSWSLGELSLHLANLVSWTAITIERTELDLEPPGGPGFAPPRYESPAATLATFDRNVAAARTAIASAGDAELLVAWTLKKGGRAELSLPRIACLRSFVMNHMIHHRGQLTVYLRLCDVPLPPIYGPTADSGF
jgi:uncharacterized damage-inducible protein DinB